MKKLDHKIYMLRRIFDYIGVIFLILLLMFIWQLYRGEVNVPFLKPYIIKALNHDDGDYQVKLDSVNLELVRSLKPLRIIATNVSYRKSDGSLSISAPKTSVSFSIKALLHGIIAPSSIDVYQPKVYAFTSYGVKEKNSSEINRKKIEYYFNKVDDFLERFNSEDNTYPESFINDINIIGAELEFHEVDIGKKWTFSDVNYRFDRGFSKLETEINALLKLNNMSSTLGLKVNYRPIDNNLGVQFYFSDLVPAHLLALLTSGEWKDNYKIAVPLNGKINFLISLNELIKNKHKPEDSLNKIVKKIQFSIEGGEGHVAFSDNEEENFNISNVVFSGDISGDLENLSIKEANLEIDGQEAELSLQVAGIKEYLLNSSPNKLSVILGAKIQKLATNDLFRYWPQSIAPDAWKWCADSLSDGNIKDASFQFDFGYDNKYKGIVFKNLSGTANASGVSLDYLQGMPKVTGVYGRIDFYNDKLQMYFNKGISDNVILEKGYIELYDLNKYHNYAKIELSGVGEIKDILRLIDNPPLQYTSEMGLNPDIIKGTAKADLSLGFEIKKSLKPNEVKVNVAATMHDVIIDEVIKGKSIDAKNLELKVDNSGLNISGIANYDGLPINLLWQENFNSKDYLSRYKLSFNFDNNFKEKLGVDYDILSSDYIIGSVPAQATITKYSPDKIIVDINGDLQRSQIDYSFLGFKKKSGIEGVISARLDIEKGKIKSIPMFSLSKPEFKLKGKVDLDANENVKVVDIYDINGPQTSAKAKIEFDSAPQEKVKINVSGSSYNLSEFFAKDDQERADSIKHRKQKKLSDITHNNPNKEKWKPQTDTDINIAVNKLFTASDVAINNFAGSAKIIKDVGINEMHLVGNFPTHSKKKKTSFLKLDYTPRPHKEYVLNIESNDAGSTMRFLRLYDHMKGGSLNISAKRDADENFVGHAKIRDFNIYNTPILAKLLTVASFSGLVDLLTGEGMAFSHLDAPFQYKDSQLKVKEAKAFGNVIGINAEGTYSMDYQEFDIKGLIAPAYGLNTFIGSIPVVGKLLSGKDGTVFAANYSISGNIDEPEIDINPLSALSPNSLKELFSSLFGGDD